MYGPGWKAAVELVLAEGWSGARAPRIWVAAEAPEGGDGPPPVTRAVVTPSDAREAWSAWAGEGDAPLPVHGRDDVETLAGRVLRWAAPVAELPLGPSGQPSGS